MTQTRAGVIVWVVERGTDCEGGRVIGVYSTEALADEAAALVQAELDRQPFCIEYVDVSEFEVDAPVS